MVALAHAGNNISAKPAILLTLDLTTANIHDAAYLLYGHGNLTAVLVRVFPDAPERDLPARKKEEASSDDARPGWAARSLGAGRRRQ